MKFFLRFICIAILAFVLSSCVNAGKKGATSLSYKYGKKIARLAGKDVSKESVSEIAQKEAEMQFTKSFVKNTRIVSIGTKKNIPIEEVVPFGNGGINAEKRTLLDICKNPVPLSLFNEIDELGIDKNVLLKIKADIKRMGSTVVPTPSNNGHVDFSSIAWKEINPVLPNKEELIKIIKNKRKNITANDITPEDIRGVSYDIAHQAIANKYGITKDQARLLIGKLDLVIHETDDGRIEIVPNNVHRFKQLYAHKGYVSKMLKLINGKEVTDEDE